MLDQLSIMLNRSLNVPDPQLGLISYNAIGEGNVDVVRRIIESPQRPLLKDVRSPKLSNPNILTQVYKLKSKIAQPAQIAIIKLLLNTYDSDISLHHKNWALSLNVDESEIFEILFNHCESDITPQDKITLFCHACERNSLETVKLLLHRCNEITPTEIGIGLLYAGKELSLATCMLLLDSYQDVISTDSKYKTLKSAIAPAGHGHLQLPLVTRLLNDGKVMHEITHKPGALDSLLEYFDRLMRFKANEVDDLNTCIDCFTKHAEIRLYLISNLHKFPDSEKAAYAAQKNCGGRIKNGRAVCNPSNSTEAKKEQPENDEKPENRKRRRTI